MILNLFKGLFYFVAKMVIWSVTFVVRIFFIPVLAIIFMTVAFLFLFGSDLAGSFMVKIGSHLIKRKI